MLIKLTLAYLVSVGLWALANLALCVFHALRGWPPPR